MELREEQKKENIPNSITYHPSSSLYHESSAEAEAEAASASAAAASILPESRRRNHEPVVLGRPGQTLDQPHLIHHHPDPDPAPAAASGTITNNTSIRYRECLKNHAANKGRHVVDGCGEFMPSGEEGTPEALRCAACDCHRNFHRRERENDYQAIATTSRHGSVLFPPHSHHQPFTMLPQAQQHRQHKYSFTNSPTAPIMMTFGGGSSGGGGGPAESSSEDLNIFHCETAQGVVANFNYNQSFSVSKKRIRTKFTQLQKEKMHEFAEKLGWKIQKQNEEEVQQFCHEFGVKRQVFKVWMHNNKQAMKRKQM
ncbi:hypothetical protein M9H77_05414 [Catharanthus roseus]|uniref:Uncharacterized protein n=1 Tax=Catharanthus roseus TaxID=4058 RepID=A0ACC0CGU9_CATRO|nr:hypothetical protein M9H77_05414 [Catharanthus roseus]